MKRLKLLILFLLVLQFSIVTYATVWDNLLEVQTESNFILENTQSRYKLNPSSKLTYDSADMYLVNEGDEHYLDSLSYTESLQWNQFSLHPTSKHWKVQARVINPKVKETLNLNLPMAVSETDIISWLYNFDGDVKSYKWTVTDHSTWLKKEYINQTPPTKLPSGTYSVKIDIISSLDFSYSSQATLIVTMSEPEKIVDISLGSSHALALRKDGYVVGWGNNSDGQLSHPLYDKAPKIISSLDNGNKYVYAGKSISAVISKYGELKVFGYDKHGRMGLGNGLSGSGDGYIDPVVPVDMDSDVEKAVFGEGHGLFLKSDGTVYAAGSGYQGQLGNYSGESSDVPLPVSLPDRAIDIAANGDSSYAVLADGTVYAWGDNGSGSLGTNESSIYVRYPIQVENITDAYKIQAGANAVIVLTYGSHEAYAWGSSAEKLFGRRPAATTLPLEVVSINNIADVGALTYSEAANFIQNDGTVLYLGINRKGQFGNGSTSTTYAPTPVKPSITFPSKPKRVSVGDGFSAVLLEDGSVWLSGLNYDKQLAQGHTSDSTQFVKAILPQ